MLSRTKFVLGLAMVFTIATLVVMSGSQAQLPTGPESGGTITGLITSVPRTMTYQGILNDSNGDPVRNTTLNVTFRIFDADSGGNELWSEIVQVTTDQRGNFTAILGETNPLNLSFDVDYYLELQIEGDPQPLEPRQKLHMAPYSARTDTAEFAESATEASNAGMVDGIHASSHPESNQLLALDDNAMFPPSVIPPVSDADMVDGFHATGTPLPNMLLALDDNAKFTNAALYMGHGSGLDADMVDGKHDGQLSADIWDNHHWGDTYPFAGNSDMLDGQHASSFVDLSSTQTIGGNKYFSNFGSTYKGSWAWLRNSPSSAIAVDEGISNGNGLYVINTSSGHPTIWARADGNTNTISARNNSAGPGYPTLWVQNENSYGTNTIFAVNNSPYSPTCWPTIYGRNLSGDCAIYADGDFCGSGGKYAVVNTSRGEALLSVIESPEVWFEDFGEGMLLDGQAHIELDPLFLETVTIDNSHPMKVFVQLRDECKGVYVKKDVTGFDIIELQEGKSNASFDFRVVAKRKGFEDARLPLAKIGHTDPATSSGSGIR